MTDTISTLELNPEEEYQDDLLFTNIDKECAHLFKLKAAIMAAIVIQKYVRGLHTRKKAVYDKGLEVKKITLKDIYDLIKSDIDKKDDILFDILSNIETLKHDMDELKLNMALIRIEVQNKTENNNTSDNLMRFMNSNIQHHQSDNSNESDEDNHRYGFNPYEDDSGDDGRFMNHRFLTSHPEEEMYSHREEEM